MQDNNACGIWDRSGDCLVPVEKLAALPRYHRETIPSDYLDAMGHMNVRWYMALFDKSVWHYFKAHGLDEAYYTNNKSGVFALKHFIQYYSEVKVGETVGLHIRLLGRSAKRFHFMIFMINESNGMLAASLESMGTHADLVARRASGMPPEITAQLDARLEIDQKLDWEAPTCGAIVI